MATVEFTLPELGENVTSGDVLRLLVGPGDVVSPDQPVLELETDKATIEVPSSVGGRVREVNVKAGDKVQVGQVVFVAEVEGGDDSDQDSTGPASAEATAAGGEPPAPDEPPAAPARAASPDRWGRRAPSRDEDPSTAAKDAEVDRAVSAPAPAPAASAEAGPVEFALPELGENVPGGEVVRVLVAVGDTVERDQPLLELETDKATIEVPSSVAGVIRELRVKEGDKISVGDVVLVVGASVDAKAPDAARAAPARARTRAARQSPSADTGPPAEGQAAAPASRPPAPARGEATAAPAGARPSVPMEDDEWPSEPEVASDESTPGMEADAAAGGLDQRVPGHVRRHGADKPGMHEDALAEAAADAPPRPRAEVVNINRGGRAQSEGEPARVPSAAAPSVRRIARELGVAIAEVAGTGPGGRISADDVKAHVKRTMTGRRREAAAAPAAPGPAAPALAPSPLPDFSKWGEIERKPMRAVRRKIAEHLANAWTQVPHVTQFDKADITALEELRKRYGKDVEAGGGKLTVTAIALKVIASAMKVFPQFSASIDVGAGEIVYKRYVHIGVAVDTDRGLLVPVIRDVDRKNIVQIAAELSQLSEKARAGKTSLEEMQGGCFTVTNLGGIGGTAFTPIVNHPEVAILGLSRSAMEPVYSDGQFQPRLMLPLSLSYDHRVIDGADAIRFLRWVCEALEQPFLLSLQG